MILRLDPRRAREVFGSRRPGPLDLRVALGFKTPKDAARLVDEELDLTLADGGTTADAVRQVLERLIEERVLVPGAEPESGRDAAGEAAGAAADARFASELASLARQLDGVAGDLAAMGAWAQEHVRSAGEDPAALLAELRERLTGLRRALRDARPRFVAAQVDAGGVVRTAAGELCLHLGCGASRRPGWTHVDLAGGDLRLNLCWELPFADGAVRCVYCAHTLEHLDYHTAAPRLLAEIRRVLVPGGVVRLVVPDLEAYMKAYAAGDQEFFREYDRLRPELGGAAGYRTHLAKVMLMAGSAARSGWFFEHKMGYDLETLAELLRRAGFAAVERSSYGASAHPDLRGMDETSGPAALAYQDVANSLFVEAAR